jgi:L-arabinokinase
MATAARFYATFDTRIAEDAQVLRERGVGFVVSDAPPLGCAAAHAAGIASVVVSNFTWDWIYEAYADEHAHAREVIETIQSAYARALAAWRLPMYGDFIPFETVINVPLVARHSGRSPEETRAHLGLPLDTRLVLSSFGGYGVQSLDLDRVQLPAGWEMVRGLEEAEIYDAGLSYQDLVRAVDVVVTKPGYGIVSECIANETAIVYTSRGVFPEYDVFVREMPRYLQCAYISNGDLLAGRWRDAIDTAVSAPAPPEQPRTNGAEVLADMIAACLPGASSFPPRASP